MARPLVLRVDVDDKGNPVLDKMNANISKVNKNTKGLGRTLTHVFGSTVMLQGLAKFKQSLVFANKEILEFNKIFKQTEGITGTSGKALNDLKQKVLDVSNVTEHTSSSLATATLNISKMGFTLEQSLAVIPHLANLATSSTAGLDEVTQIAVQTMKSFQLQATDMEHIVNVIQGTVSKTAIGFLDFAESMKFIAPIAKTMNVSIEETAAMIGILGDIGIKGSLGGTTLKNMFLNILKPSDKVRKVIQSMNSEGLTFNKILKEMDRTGIGVKDFLETFNKRAVAGSLALSQLTGKTAELQKVLEEDGVKVVDVSNKIREAWIPQMQILRNTFINTFVVMGEILDRSDVGLGIEGITLEFIKLQEWLQKNPDALIRFATELANIVKIVGVALTKAVVFLVKHLDELKLAIKIIFALEIMKHFAKSALGISAAAKATTGLISRMTMLSQIIPIIGQVTIAIWALGEAMEFLADKSIAARKAAIQASFGTKEGEILKQIDAVKELHRQLTNLNLTFKEGTKSFKASGKGFLGFSASDLGKDITKTELVSKIITKIAQDFGMTEEAIKVFSQNTIVHLDVLYNKLKEARGKADDIENINKGAGKFNLDVSTKGKASKKQWWEEQFDFLQASARLSENIAKSLKLGVNASSGIKVSTDKILGSFSPQIAYGAPAPSGFLTNDFSAEAVTKVNFGSAVTDASKQISTFESANNTMFSIALTRISDTDKANEESFVKWKKIIADKGVILQGFYDYTITENQEKLAEEEIRRGEELLEYRRDQFDQYTEAAMLQVDLIQMIQDAGFARSKERMGKELAAFEKKSKRELAVVQGNSFKTQIVEKQQLKQKAKLLAEQEKLEKEQLNKRRIWSMIEVAINTAVGVSAALRGSPPASFVLAAITAAMGLAQLAVISQQDSYKTGGFTGRGSDSEVAGTVHKNEFVVDADNTRLLGGPEGVQD